MNERIIWDFVSKAREFAISDTPDGGKCFDQDAFHNKFAELIVKDITTGQRELAKIMSDTGSEDQAYILRITASNIERKYGVEE